MESPCFLGVSSWVWSLFWEIIGLYHHSPLRYVMLRRDATSGIPGQGLGCGEEPERGHHSEAPLQT